MSSKAEIRAERWAGRVTMVWAAVVMSVSLGAAVPYMHWVVTALALTLISPLLFRRLRTIKYPSRLPSWLFVICVCVPALYGANIPYSLGEAAKLAVILLGSIPVLVLSDELPRYAIRGFVIAAWLNIALLLGGFLGLQSASIMTAPVRWGTLLNTPGPLSRVGVSVWALAAYLFVKRRSPAALALLLGSTLLVYADGSRTAILSLVLGVFYIGSILVFESARPVRALVAAAAGAGVLSLAVAGFFAGRADNLPEGGLQRVTQLTTTVGSGGFQGLEAADIIRFQMLQDVEDAIRAHPIWGTGFETTTTETIVGPLVIHMTYLQVWADLGFIALPIFVWLVWGWIIWLPRILPRIGVFPLDQRALYYNAVFLLIVFGFEALFHPLSTEWSDWLQFIVPSAFIWQLIHTKNASPRTRPIQVKV